jgi:hypothetical protein
VVVLGEAQMAVFWRCRRRLGRCCMRRDRALEVRFSIVPVVKRVGVLTGSAVRLNVVVVFGLSDLAVPVDTSTVRTDAELLV